MTIFLLLLFFLFFFSLCAKKLDFNFYDSVVYSNRCAAHLRLCQLDNAHSDAIQCLALDPSFWKGYSRLAEVLVAKSLRAPAALCYRKCLDLNPDNPVATQALADIEETEPSFALYSRYATASPKWDWKGMMGREAEVSKIFQRISEDFAAYPFYRIFMEKYFDRYLADGVMLSAAYKEMEEHLQMGPNPVSCVHEFAFLRQHGTQKRGILSLLDSVAFLLIEMNAGHSVAHTLFNMPALQGNDTMLQRVNPLLEMLALSHERLRGAFNPLVCLQTSALILAGCAKIITRSFFIKSEDLRVGRFYSEVVWRLNAPHSMCSLCARSDDYDSALCICPSVGVTPRGSDPLQEMVNYARDPHFVKNMARATKTDSDDVLSVLLHHKILYPVCMGTHYLASSPDTDLKLEPERALEEFLNSQLLTPGLRSDPTPAKFSARVRAMIKTPPVMVVRILANFMRSSVTATIRIVKEKVLVQLLFYVLELSLDYSLSSKPHIGPKNLLTVGNLRCLELCCQILRCVNAIGRLYALRETLIAMHFPQLLYKIQFLEFEPLRELALMGRLMILGLGCDHGCIGTKVPSVGKQELAHLSPSLKDVNFLYGTVILDLDQAAWAISPFSTPHQRLIAPAPGDGHSLFFSLDRVGPVFRMSMVFVSLFSNNFVIIFRQDFDTLDEANKYWITEANETTHYWVRLEDVSAPWLLENFYLTTKINTVYSFLF